MPELIEFFPANPAIAFLFSLLLNIIISIAGFIPSAFLTAANLVFFGFKNGMVISITGEAIGAIISFYIYRKGISTIQKRRELFSENKFVNKLRNARGLEAVLLVLLLRVLPFVPSGIVTLSAAISKMGILSFALTSTLGKIPSLYIEALSVYTVMEWKVQYQIITVSAIFIIYLLYKLGKKKNGGDHA